SVAEEQLRKDFKDQFARNGCEAETSRSSITLRPEHLDAEPALERTAEAVFHLWPLVGHRRRAQESLFRNDAQNSHYRPILGQDCRQLPLKFLKRLHGVPAREAPPARAGGATGPPVVHHGKAAPR